MANSFITMKNIARRALPVLVDNLVMPNLMYTDASADFVGKGDTVQIRKPASFTAAEFSTSISAQDNNQSAVDVTMDKLYDVSVAITSKDLALKEEDFFMNVAEPMAVALAEKINSEGLSLVEDIPYYSGTAGTTPDALSDFSDIRKGLNSRKVPLTGRSAVWNVDADAKFTQLDGLVKVNESGSPQALREGEIGRVFGLNNYYSQAVYEHTAGTAVTTTAPKVKGATSAGATSIIVDAASMVGTILTGDLLTIGDYTYVVTADATAATNQVTLAIYPAVQADIADNAAVTFVAADSVKNVGFHKNAFAFVTRSLPIPEGMTPTEAYATSYNGVTLRVIKWYDGSAKTEYMSMDVLCGFKTIYPELAHIQLG